YRDWAWEQAGSDELRRSVTALREVAREEPLGRTLVFGAAACRLPYELALGFGATEVVAIDIDPFTFVVAEAIVRGRTLRLTEANLGVQDADHLSRTWTVAAPAGPRATDDFHFVLGNGLAPPFAAGSFDTVVTPWFIDQVPPDAGKFFDTLARLVRPGGRWLNQGPLLYRVDLPLALRHPRQEIFERANAAGFRVDKWASESRPYLVSPLNGRGRIEAVLSFAATRVR
ncbi:MAG TPA: class I SAM-dependent methyltransferase, partial [Polyangia bacterium]